MTSQSTQKFWQPELSVSRAPDGVIHIAQKSPLPAHDQILADYLDKWATKTPERRFLARRDNQGAWRYITYEEARDKARIIGAHLLQQGLGPDKPLLILSENSLEHGLLGLACTYVGIPFAPVSPAYSLVSKDHAKLKAIATLLQPGAVFADNGAAFSHAISAIKQPQTVIINQRNHIDGAVNFTGLLTGSADLADEARRRLTPDTVVKYLFTSGSTGAPKAVINTHKMICAMQAMVRDCYRFLTYDPPIVLDWAPWNHTAAGNKVFNLVMTNGGTYYIDDGRPAAGKFDETLRNLKEISCSWYFNVPMGWDMLVERLETDHALAETFFAKLHMMFYAGAGMAQLTWDRLRAISKSVKGEEILLATSLGATETAPFALACTEFQEKSGNVGVPARGLQMKLVPFGDKYELRLKGPSITPGYYGDLEKTSEMFDEDGFYKMGDALRAADPNDLNKGFYFDGRIGENFKLATGTWVSVGAVRAKLVDSLDGLIKDAVIVGENETRLGALLILSDAAKDMTSNRLRATLQQKLAESAKRISGSASKVVKMMIVEREPSFDKGEITEKGSLNQRKMRENHQDLVTRLYRNDPHMISIEMS